MDKKAKVPQKPKQQKPPKAKGDSATKR